jgi:hypothetical protein
MASTALAAKKPEIPLPSSERGSWMNRRIDEFDLWFAFDVEKSPMWGVNVPHEHRLFLPHHIDVAHRDGGELIKSEARDRVDDMAKALRE